MRNTDTDQCRAAVGKRARCALLALSRRGGLTLMELLVALAVAAIVSSAAMPSLLSLLHKQQLRAALNDLQGAIALTRSLAIARGSVVLMAPQDAGGAWEQGWTVFADANGNRRLDSGEERYAVQQALPQGLRLAAHFTSGTGAAYLAYNAAGRSCQAGNSQAARWGTLTLQAGAHKRLVKINMLGRVRVCDPVAQPALCTSAD